MSSKKFRKLCRNIEDICTEVVANSAPDVDIKARFPHETFETLKAEKLLSAYVPEEFGGHGLSVSEVGELCEILGRYCGSSGMIYAMHNIMAACIVNHHADDDYFLEYIGRIADEQILLASAHSEIGTGGDLARSKCAMETSPQGLKLVKQTPCISYGEYADAILLTARKDPDASERDQVQVIYNRGDFQIEKVSTWDSMGMRGTCSPGFIFNGTCSHDQVFPVPFSDITKKTMSPVTHILWGYMWAGIAKSTFQNASQVAQSERKKDPTGHHPSAMRLAEVQSRLFSLKNDVELLARDYEQMYALNDISVFDDLDFAIRVNNVKINSSRQAVDVALGALQICGIAGYKNDSPVSLARQVRDLLSSTIMINNDRIVENNARLLISS